MKILLLCLFVFGFAFLADAQISLTEANKDTAITMLQPAKGTDLTVTLKNNGGTPYTWKIAASNDNLFTFDKEEQRNTYKPKEGEPPMTGTPYLTDFKFKFTGEAGKGHLKFDLTSFSGEVAQSVEYTFMIKKDTRPVKNPDAGSKPLEGKPKKKAKSKKKKK